MRREYSQCWRSIQILDKEIFLKTETRTRYIWFKLKRKSIKSDVWKKHRRNLFSLASPIHISSFSHISSNQILTDGTLILAWGFRFDLGIDNHYSIYEDLIDLKKFIFLVFKSSYYNLDQLLLKMNPQILRSSMVAAGIYQSIKRVCNHIFIKNSYVLDFLV